MSGLIKSRDANASHRVRPLTSLSRSPEIAPVAAPPISELAALRRDLAQARSALAARDTELAELAQERDRAREEGRAEGRTAGLHEAKANHVEALARLNEGVGAALSRFCDDLQALERLAALVAREGLARVLGPDSDRRSILDEAVRHQVQQIEAGSIVRVEVSRADFPDPAALAELAQTLDRPGLAIHASSDLGAGDCRIKLRLGALEIGLGQQWHELNAALEQLAAHGVAP